MDVKMNLRIITKNHEALSKIGFSLKIDFRADWTHESHPTAWELITNDNESIWSMYIDIRNSVAIRDLNYGQTNVSYGF